LVTIAAAPLSAQDEGTPTQLWLNYQFQQKVGEKTRVFGTLSYEELMSRESFWGEWNRLAVRGGGSVDLGSRFRVALGGDLRYTYRHKIDDLFEFRLWQEGTAYWPERTGGFRRWVLVHRLRVEERITESDGWGFAMRLRYRLEIKLPLNKYTLEPKTYLTSFSRVTLESWDRIFRIVTASQNDWHFDFEEKRPRRQKHARRR